MAQKLDRAEFGPNTWLIDEMHRAYLDNPTSVGEAWQEFFADYQPRTRLSEAPSTTPAQRSPTPVPERIPVPSDLVPNGEAPAEVIALRGAAAVQAERMEESLGVPTATSMRAVPARLLEVNRTILNAYLQRTGGGKVSFTHLIGWAVARALADVPAMNSIYREVDGRPNVIRNSHVNLGLAVDVKKADGTRALLVPNIRGAESLEFAAFFAAYEDLIRKVSAGSLKPDDFGGTTVTITNPGTIGTLASVPRLMAGQAAIIGVGSIDYPAEFAGADPGALAELG
ncbi:MAG: multifunctional 2-oxoglutarate metabolism enzyme, partial [Actinomycetota bacterium]|nr:multifunctional 2-oxoglutarate metabolism enzyme [Actinomycetota bacterium]